MRTGSSCAIPLPLQPGLSGCMLCSDRQCQNVHWQVTEASTVVLAGSSCPNVKLDDKYYKLVDKMEALTEAPPSLLGAKSLTVKGPVLFKRGVVFKGDVLVVNGVPPPACVTLLGHFRACPQGWWRQCHAWRVSGTCNGATWRSPGQTW